MNKHRGSDFNEFLAKENLMTPTPRTDAIAHRGLGSVAYIAEMTSFARELERELATERTLADRLAGELQSWGDYCGDNAPASIDPVLAAWKEARSGSV